MRCGDSVLTFARRLACSNRGVYRGEWTHNGAPWAVVVEVVPPSQAAHEARVLATVGARKQAPAILYRCWRQSPALFEVRAFAA